MEFDLSTLQPKERASFALRALYEAAGCRKYHMGRFEEYGLYQENRSFLSSEQVITFTDLDGRLLALKPDVTLSIAKTAQPAPGETLRYYYHENVYRPSAESHTFKEIGQMGLEFLGGVGEAEVQQAVCLAAQSLGQLGTDWVLEVSHMGYLFGLLDALQVPDAARAELLRKLGQKNAHELRAAALAAGLDEDAADTLCRVLTLCGGYADTLPRAEALCRNDAMRAAVAELQGLAGPLEQAGGAIRLDLTLAGTTAEKVAEGIAEYYKDAATVKVHALNETLPENGLYSNAMAGTDRMELYMTVNAAGDQMMLVSLFDNLGKGSSGAALQCMNLMLGLPETEGLE